MNKILFWPMLDKSELILETDSSTITTEKSVYKKREIRKFQKKKQAIIYERVKPRK